MGKAEIRSRLDIPGLYGFPIMDSAVWLSPMVLIFFVIIVGYEIGRIRVRGLSFDLAAVLLCAVGTGYMISRLLPGSDREALSSLQSSTKSIAELGTAILVSAIGLETGYSIAGGAARRSLRYGLIGAAMVLTGFLGMKGIGFWDTKVSPSVLTGLLCGALTSTPGMAAACEGSGAAEEILIGYGAAYLCGVTVTVLSVQILLRKTRKERSEPQKNLFSEEVRPFEFLIQIGAAAVLGTILSGIRLRYGKVSLGATGGMLWAGIVIGALIRRFFPQKVKSPQTVSVFRNTGLVLFLAGNGIAAGLQWRSGLEPVWLVYGLVLAVMPILTGYGLCRILRCTRQQTVGVLAGGMTSTPAMGMVINQETDADLSVYSMAYAGALLTMVGGMSLF